MWRLTVESETEELLVNLPVIPRMKIRYRDSEFEEMDLDAILARRPQVALVDELAHTNVSGSRHAKRWQDVAELLDAGIDVYTTLNVQHIESRKEAVESVTGGVVRETVPDSILERADSFELIDLTPEELLKRLSEGKVYLGDKAERAAQNFFKEDRLTALREIALRITAEQVDNELQQLMATKPTAGAWKPGERLMVAVSHSPHSEGLIRATRRLAFSLEASWIAVNVDTGASLNEEDRMTLSRNLALVRELGGEVVSTADPDVVAALQRIADQRQVTQMIIGRPSRRWLKDVFLGGTLLDRLVRKSEGFDIHVLRPEKPSQRSRWKWRSKPSFTSLYEYWWAVAAVALTAVISSAIYPYVSYRAIGFLFLLTVLLLSLSFALGPILLAAFLSALVWDFFFIPPSGTFTIAQPEDIIMCVAYLAAALITGTLTHRIRLRERMLRLREERTETLYGIVRNIVGASDKLALAHTVCEKLGATLNGSCVILLTDPSNQAQLTPVGNTEWNFTEKEQAVAKWVFTNRKLAGWSTDTLPDAGALFLPLQGPAEMIGVLAYRPNTNNRLLREEEDLLSAVCRQAAIAIERELFRERSRLAERLQESERLHQTILDSVSHEIRTPLTAIIGMASALGDEYVTANPLVRDEMSHELVKTAERLDRVVNNLLDMSRLSSGALTLNRDWYEAQDLIALTLAQVGDSLGNHKLDVSVLDGLPLLRIDVQLFVQVLANVILNAACYSRSGSAIMLTANLRGSEFVLSVSDQGEGVPDGLLPRIFDKFYRMPGSKAGGTGLGLAVAKSIVEAHGGRIEAHNRLEGGLVVEIRLPVETQPELPQEPS